MNPDAPSTPPAPPHSSHVFLCPSCECTLEHVADQAVSGTNDVTELFSCPSGCGTFEHERQTHRLRFVEGSAQHPRTS